MVLQDAPRPWQPRLPAAPDARRALHSVSDVEMDEDSTLDSASRGSRRARRAAQTAQKRQLGPDESSSEVGEAGQVLTPRITGRPWFFTLHHDFFPANAFPHGHPCPRFDSAGHSSKDRPRCEAIVLCRTILTCSCTMPG